MLYIIYDVVAIIIFIFFIIPIYVYRSFRESGFPKRFRQSMGFLHDEEVACVVGRNAIWIHGASVGEIVATSPLVKEIRKMFPEVPIVVSAVTTSGYAMAKRIIPEADAVIFFPLDMPFVTGLVVERIQPRIFMPVETELWPNFLKDISTRGIPVMMVNGRISDKSVKTYKYLYGILDNMLRGVVRFCMQSALDAEYIMRLGADPGKVVITGNTKFDQTYAEVTAEDKERFREEMGITGNKPVIVAGSTHVGEEKTLIASFAQLRKQFPDACLLIAPRKHGRLHEIQSIAKEAGFVCGKRSELLKQTERESFPIVLIDTIGELGRIYAVGDVVFVGGSLIRRGGHNVLEPAAHGKPIVVGPNMFNFKEAHALLKNYGACVTVNNQEELTATLLNILSDDGLRSKMGAASYAVIEENRGAAAKSILFLCDVLAGPSARKRSNIYIIANRSSGEDSTLTRRAEFYLYKLLHGNVRNGKDIFMLYFLSVVSLLYGFGLAGKLSLYKLGFFRKTQLSCKVISLGNITLGGTGKTPTAKMLAHMLLNMGYKVVLLNRGYRAHWDKPVGIVSDGKKIYMNAYEAGDEAYLLAKQLPGVPVVIGKDRAISGEYVDKNMDVDVIIMDDGYQHWQLARDLDIVLVDTLNMFGNSRLLPRGILREPLSNLDRADIFLLTKIDQSSDFSRKYVREVLRKKNPGAPVFESIHMPRCFIEIDKWEEGSKEHIPTASLLGRPAIAFSAIGNPASFEQTITDLGVELIEVIRYPDHHDYDMKEMQYVMNRAADKQADAIIITEKDAVKIPKEFMALKRPFPLYVLCIEVQLIGGEALFQEVLTGSLRKEKR